ncbi:MAG: hypothetical protein Q8Q49_01615 [bacterium]|nr:hypothetical protein [bacterium]
MQDDLSIRIELAVIKAFEKEMPKLLEQCRENDEKVVATCPAAALFRDNDAVAMFRDMEFSYRKGIKKQAYIIGAVVALVNGAVLILLRHFL